MSADEIFPFTCRCCARSEIDTKTLKLQSIHERPPGSTDLMSIAEIFIETTSRVNIKSYDDELPKLICTDCIKKVLQMKNFLDTCIESERIMRSIIDESKFNQPTEDLYMSIDGSSLDNETKPIKFIEINKNPTNEEIALTNALKVEADTKLKATKSKYFEISIKDEPPPSDDDCSDMATTTTNNVLNESSSIFCPNEQPIQSNPERPNKCKYCDRTFTINSDLCNHLRVHFGEKIHLCELCPKNFQSSAELQDHSKVHINESTEIKKKNLDERLAFDLKVRKINKTIEKYPVCDYCGKFFSSVLSLIIHKNKHKGKIPQICRYCKNSIRPTEVMMEHYRLHLGVFNYICEFCPKGFQSNAELRKHYNVHNFEDVETKKSNLAAREAFDEKIRTNEKMKPHANEICSPKLELPKRVHCNNKNSYKCRFCGLAFLTRSSLTRHLQRHIGDNMYSCKLCPCFFLQVADLRKHYVEHENEDAETRQRNLAAEQKVNAEVQDKLNITTAEDLVKGVTNTEASIFKNSTLVKEELEFMDYTNVEQEKEKNMLTEIKLEADIENEAEQTTNKCFVANVENEPLSDDDASILTDLSIINSYTGKMDYTNEISETEAAKTNECEHCGKCFREANGLKIHMHTHRKGKPYKCRQCDFETIRRFCLIKHLEKHISDSIYSCKFCPLAFRSYYELKKHCAEHKTDNFQTKVKYLAARRKKDDELLKLNQGCKPNQSGSVRSRFLVRAATLLDIRSEP